MAHHPLNRRGQDAEGRHCSSPREAREVGSDDPSAIQWRQSLLTLSREVYHFQDVPLRKHVLDAFFESLLILSDFFIPIKSKAFSPFLSLNSIQRVVFFILNFFHIP